MAAQKVVKKRKRARKARTDVSSSSASSSDSDSPPQSPIAASTAVAQNDVQIRETHTKSQSSDSEPEATPPTPQRQQALHPDQAFEDFYLKQATKEFSDDLDKLRSAPDFKAGSVPILIEALRQGTATFGPEERRKVGQGGLSGR